MLDAQTQETKGHQLKDSEILAQMVLFILAGYDTSSNILGLTCYNLAVFPEAQERVIEEISQVCSSSETVTYEEIQKMPYLEACIAETLRLYPPGRLILLFNPQSASKCERLMRCFERLKLLESGRQFPRTSFLYKQDYISFHLNLNARKRLVYSKFLGDIQN